MATTAAAIDQAANPKSVDESLYFDSFTDIFKELGNVYLSSSGIPKSLTKKLKSNHVWFLETVSMFKPPNQKSRSALDSNVVNVGSHKFIIDAELKDIALELSRIADLDEVQSYIIVTRFVQHAADIKLHLMLLEYHMERQCLLKCTRQIIMHSLYIEDIPQNENVIIEETSKLISDGLDRKLPTVLQDLRFSKHLENMEADLVTLWGEEILIEDKLALDILFLMYYESLCTCDGKQWKNLCSLYKEILSKSFKFQGTGLSFKEKSSFDHSKVQFLLILIEALDLKILLQMVHDEVPFRQGHSVFTYTDIQEMDAMVSSLSAVDTQEAGPLIMAWAVFICLISALPEKQDQFVLMDIDHVAYVHEAFKAAPLSLILQILESDMFKDSDGPVTGYRSVLRTLVSSFIACYDITQQLDDGTLSLILDIICKIYRMEESLCSLFWDRDSSVDGPIRCLLDTFEVEFPFRNMELVRLLSALCVGTWPAECVYNFLDKSIGISSLFEIPGDMCIENISQTIMTPQALRVPEVEDLLIPSQTRGHVVKVCGRSTVLVRWEYRQSGVFVLLLRLARHLYLNHYEETHLILDLLCRLVSSNKAVCAALMDFDNSFSVHTSRLKGHVEKSMRVDVVEIICALVKNLSPNLRSVLVMSTSVSILAKMLKCSPSHVSEVVLKQNIFDLGVKKHDIDVYPNESGMWLLSSGLARMLSIDSEQAEDCCSLTLSVLDFTQQLVETGAEDDVSMALVVFSLQYIFVNHELWKYRVKHARWKVTLKVLELMKICVMAVPTSEKLGGIVKDSLLSDSSVHSSLCRIMCITTETLEKLKFSRLYEVEEIEGLRMSVCSALDVVFAMLTAFPKDTPFSMPVFHQAMLSSTTNPIPVVTAVISLTSYFWDPAIQVGAAKVLSVLCVIAENTQPYKFGNVSLVSDDKQVTNLRCSIYDILSEETPKSEDLFVAILKLLTSAARHQPAFLVSIIAPKETVVTPLSNGNVVKQPPVKVSLQSLELKKINIIDALLHYVQSSKDFIESHPHLLLHVLIFLKVLWKGTTQYVQILELFRTSEVFWRSLCSIFEVASNKDPHRNLTGNDSPSLAYKYQCQSAVIEIMAYDLFLEKKLLQTESSIEQTSEKSKAASPANVQNIVLAWCESTAMENLIKSYASCEYDNEILFQAKIASNMFLVHVMEKVITGDTGSLSLSLLRKIQYISKELCGQPAFSELLVQYSQRGYSGGKELNSLILSDLYYHLQGELEGRKMNSPPFRELAQFLLQSNFSQTEHNYKRDFLGHVSDVYVFDLVCIRKDLGLPFWDHSKWEASKVIVEKMLSYMQDANLMSFFLSSKLRALKALTTILSVYGGNLTEIKTGSIGRGMSETLLSSCVEGVCKCLQTTVESLVSAVGPSADIINFFGAQAELLLCLIRLLCKRFSEKTNRLLSLRIFALVLKTSATSLRVLCSIVPSMDALVAIMNFFLLALLLSAECFQSSSSFQEKEDKKSAEAFTEVSLLCLGLLPILCSCTEIVDCCNLSVALMDLILNGFLTSSTWLPIIQKHLRLQLVIQKLRERDSFPCVPIILKFLLTLARIRGGAEILQTANFFLSLKVLINILLDQKTAFSVQDGSGVPISTGEDEKRQHIWGLGLTVVTAMIYSLGGSLSCVDFVDTVIPYFLSEKDYVMLYHLDLPYLPSDVHGKKRARTQKTHTSLTALREIEHTLMFICVAAKHRKSWLKSMKEMNSQIRERSIHLLAYISRGAQCIAESSGRTAPLLCPPALKEEVDLNRKPSFINCKHGWFSLLRIGWVPRTHSPVFSSTVLVPFCADQTAQSDLVSHTHFSDVVTIQIYRIAVLVLNFLCLQATEAANRAEEMGFINLAHFPELPMPEILHGLQDQAIAIVSELCQTNKSKQMQCEIQDFCFLMLQMLEKSLYLEFCVAQSCGIRPVLGRVEDFSKEFKILVQVAEEHTSLKPSLKSLGQIISFVYPGMLQADGFLQVVHVLTRFDVNA